MIQYDEQTLQLIEEEICYIYDSDATGYPEGEYLLDLRKRILNEQALTRESQAELLPDIIAFNDALPESLERIEPTAFDRCNRIERVFIPKGSIDYFMRFDALKQYRHRLIELG